MLRILAAFFVAVWALPAAGLVIEGEDDAATLSAPADDPGWSYVGTRGGTSVVYLQDGWVLAAGHSGLGDVELDGTRHEAVPGTRVRLHDRDGSPADLQLFRIAPAPGLPPVELTRWPLSAGAKVTLIAVGRARGERYEWRGRAGYRWRPGREKRWGTNRVEVPALDVLAGETRTRCFQLSFDADGTPHEAQGATGDSGGGVFAKTPEGWRLVGLLLTVGTDPEQRPGTALYGNVTNAADLYFYRRQILEVLQGKHEAPQAP